MGKIQLVTKEQKIILGEIKQSVFLQSHFYFSGGTALSAVYLQHRYSDDLDFFSKEKFDNQVLLTLVQEWSKKYRFTFKPRFVEVVYIFDLVFPNKSTLKLDFSYYPWNQIEKPQLLEDVYVDSLIDIAVNKLLTISQRNEVKDFVDLYFLLKNFSIWDLRIGVQAKFNIEIDPLLLAADMLKVDYYDYLPKMIKPLPLDELKSFFKQKSKELGGRTLK